MFVRAQMEDHVCFLAHWLDQRLVELSADRHFQHLLGTASLEQIGDQHYLSTEAGLEVVLTEGLTVTAIHLKAPTAEQSGYKGALPLSLHFTHTRAEIQQALAAKGIRGIAGGGSQHAILGRIPRWEKYYLATYHLHVQYAPHDQSVEMLTLLAC